MNRPKMANSLKFHAEMYTSQMTSLWRTSVKKTNRGESESTREKAYADHYRIYRYLLQKYGSTEVPEVDDLEQQLHFPSTDALEFCLKAFAIGEFT